MGGFGFFRAPLGGQTQIAQPQTQPAPVVQPQQVPQSPSLTQVLAGLGKTPITNTAALGSNLLADALNQYRINHPPKPAGQTPAGQTPAPGGAVANTAGQDPMDGLY